MISAKYNCSIECSKMCIICSQSIWNNKFKCDEVQCDNNIILNHYYYNKYDCSGECSKMCV